MVCWRALLPLLLCCNALPTPSLPGLPAPERLLVDLMPPVSSPLVVIADSDEPSFSFAVEDVPKGVGMAAFRLTVRDAHNNTAWDSHKVSGSFPVGVKCGARLSTGATYTWTAQWWSNTSEASPVTTGVFDVALAGGDWSGAVWLGGGHGQFRVDAQAIDVSNGARLHIASPGGVTVSVNGNPVGDEVGLSLWTDFSKTVPYVTYDVAAVLASTPSPEIIITCGRGFWMSGHAKGPGKEQAMRFLLIAANHTVRSGDLSVQGRKGPVLADDPWLGTVTDTTLSPASGWTTTIHAASIPEGELVPLPRPYARTRENYPAVSVTPLKSRPGAFLYTFPNNIVGYARLQAGALAGSGNVTLEHCEQWNHTAEGCIPFGMPPFPLPLPRCELNGCDTYIVDAGKPVVLAPRFTWHGFQYVVVAPGSGVSLHSSADALSAHWSTADLEESATISFGGEGAEILAGIMAMTKASQTSNLAAYMPTDCPTREKHGWLGDSQVTAEEAMYNVWTPSIYSRFLSQIKDSQLTSGDNKGFVAGVVPGGTSEHPPDHTGKTAGLDISWTAAYPLDAGWLLKYYGDVSSASNHWQGIKAYMDGQLRVEDARNASGLPDFWTWGDWCAVEDRATCTPSTGPIAASANFLLALASTADLASSLDLPAEAARYQHIRQQLLEVYDKRWWNATTRTWASRGLEVQTLTSIALAAGVGSVARRAAAVEALKDDVAARGHHLTVGSAGQKWLLRTLSEEGAHDTALRVAMQTTEPSWGYWLGQGATTCWENWSGVAGGSHPPTPTHNHIFLCGGVGEWMFEYLAGITPTSPGYSTVSIKPKISKSVGPSSVHASVQTVRGAVRSSWTRLVHSMDTTPAPGTPLLQVRATIPFMSTGTIVLPLLGMHAARVRVSLGGEDEEEVAVVWAEGVSVSHPHVLTCRVRVDPGAEHTLELEVVPGSFVFVVEAQ